MNRFLYRVEHRDAEMGLPALAGGDSANDLRAVLDHLLGVEAAFAAGHPAHENASVSVNENCHGSRYSTEPCMPPKGVTPLGEPRWEMPVGPSQSPLVRQAASQLGPGRREEPCDS